MSRVLETRSHNFIEASVSLPAALDKLIDSGFKTERDCILFNMGFETADQNNEDIEKLWQGLDTDEKKTDYESFENHIHVDDYMTDSPDEFEYLKVGLEFGKRIYERLKLDFQKDFRITVSYSETTYEGQEVDTYGGCVVKFYTIRSSCDDLFRIDDLDKFEMEGVLVIE